MTKPDDRELEQYLKGDGALSRRYREAGGETAPPELDEVILARARAEVRRKPDFNRALAPVALAASLVLAVNLAWNITRVEPLPDPGRAAAPAGVPSEYELPAPGATPPAAAAPAAPPPAARRQAAAPPPEGDVEDPKVSQGAGPVADTPDDARAEPHAVLEERVQAMNRERRKAEAAQATALQSADAVGTAATQLPLTEAQKTDRLVAYIGGLEGAVFIRNGKAYGPAEAAKHLAYKREKAGGRVKTAEDFIRLCASFSSVSGDAYLVRFADGRTRTAEDVLREELARISAGG